MQALRGASSVSAATGTRRRSAGYRTRPRNKGEIVPLYRTPQHSRWQHSRPATGRAHQRMAVIAFFILVRY
ncbi:MAG: hypothetical protein MUC60_05805 [Oscillatoria sp. Prado101]|nr:hypothetical protein [Oscillatoria sp. Prado101]